MTEATLDSPQGIAIVGMSGRFPEAPDLDRFWENLRGGVEAVSFFTDEELAAAGVEPAVLADPLYVKARGVLPGVELFDPDFFGFTPREAELLDPQHRAFLECSWEALESAGYDPERFPGRIAVYGGAGSNSYVLNNLLPHEELLRKVGGLQVVLMNQGDFLTTRVSYKLNLRGPSVLVQTACSTALVAVHMACQSLLAGEVDMALAGGVSVDVPQVSGYFYQEAGVASPDGRCRAFDERAAGTVGGSGAGVVVLKRLDDALADGDTVHAVIKGSAVNNDGSAKVGFTAPSVEGQAEAIAESLLMAGFEPDTIGYVEAHGSGTALGDPVEIAALTQAFRAGTERTGFCAVGSVKSSVGHCNAAAGIAGLLKTVLALKHGEIPPSLHFERPNPRIDFAGSPFYVNARLSPWPEQPGQEVRRAGVSSFGLGGTNAHVVLEEAPPAEAAEPSLRPAQLLTVSARTASALERAEANLDEFLRGHPEMDAADVAHTLQVGRRAFEHRRARLVRDGRELASASGVCAANAARPVVFLFPGLGDQSVDMARELYEVEPTFREQFDLCADLLAPYLDLDLRRVLFSEGGAVPRSGGPGLDLKALLRRDGRADDPAAARLARTEVAQPIHFAVEYSLARLLMEWGLVPEAMIGYSIGEYVAACLAGALSLEDAVLLVARRAKLIQDLPGGAMLAVPLPEAEVRPLLPETLSVAATNGPHLTVVGGPEEAVADFERSLGERGVSSITLRTTHAFHTEMMEPAVEGLTEIARRLEVQPPSIPYLSNVTGTWITPEDLADPGYWARHMRGTVRFAEGLAELLGRPERLLVEIGPGGTLGTLAKQHPKAPAGLVTVSALPGPGEGRSDEEHLLAALGRLWAAGAEVDWNGFAAHEHRRRVPLPTYPFERQRCWIDPPRGGARAALPMVATESADLADWFYLPVWKQAAPVPLASSSRQGERWLVIPDGEGFGDRLAERLRREGAEVVPDASAHPTHVLHLAGLTRDEPSADEALEKGLVGLVMLQQALAHSESPVRLAVVANHLAEVIDGDLVVPAKAALLGACKVVHQESPRLTCGALDVILPEPGSPAEERLAGQILSEMDGELSPAVAYRGRQRWIRGFEPVRLGPASASPLVEEGVYLITDPDHGVGPALTDFLTRELRARVIRGLSPDLLRSVRVDGVFHTAGSSAGGLLQLKTAEGIAASLGPVAREVEALFAALREAGAEPAFVALCSSTLAFSGGLGQLESAATGALLDAVAQGQNDPRTLAIHWDPYQWGGWLAAGVGAALVPGFGQEQMQKNLDSFAIPAHRSGEALRRLLASPLSRAAVAARDLSSLIAETDAFTLDAFLSQMEGARSAETHRREGLSTPYEPPRGETEERLAGLWQELFGIDRIGIHDDFLELGGHSLLAIQLMTQIRTAFEVDLPLPTLFESPSVAQLAAVIDGERGDELERLLAAVEGLSPEEALQRMSEL